MPQKPNKEIIIVKLMGGLGNQMFQYAAGKALALKNDCELKLDVEFLLDRTNKPKNFIARNYDLDIFKLQVAIATSEEIKKIIPQKQSRVLSKILKPIFGFSGNYLKQPGFGFYNNFFEHSCPLYLDGYWQSEKFFKRFEPVIREDFEFKYPIPEQSLQLAKKISETNSICVNIRRGDFVNNELHGVLGLDYYQDAERIITNKIKQPAYFIFSDDIYWCKNNISFEAPTEFIEHIHAGKKFNTYLQLMILCNHFIIPNSSFGWWAAWLNNNPSKIVIAPQKWFNNGPKDTQDLVPDNWIRI